MCLHIPLLEIVHAHGSGEGTSLPWELWQVCLTERLFWGILITWIFVFFEGECAGMLFFFCERVRCVCLHGLRVCIIVFSARLAVPVCARVQVAHDPGSAGRSVSFMSPVQFSLKSGSKDKRITPICCDTHTHTHTQTHTGLFLKNDFLEIWVVTRWHRGGRWGGQLFKIHLM